MHIKCPHCQNAVELVESTADTASVVCPTCGSAFAILPETAPLESDFGAIGQFELRQRVGRGHFGEVWKAWDQTLGRNVALKLPRLAPGATSAERQYQEMFVREARSAAQLRHPHIVSVHEIARAPRGIVIVSDFIEGVDLANLIQHRRPSYQRSAEIVRTVALALQHAHERGIIHRDLKPANILIDVGGEPYVTDFGLAKRSAGEITVTLDGRILGTPAYMPPEQASGKGHQADARSDVYSLGVILYELLCGQRPFMGDQTLLVYQIAHEEPRPPSAIEKDIPLDLETIALRALEKDPARRFQTAQEMADELDRALRGEPIHSRRAGRLERGWRLIKRNRLVSALSLATAISFVLFVSVAWGWFSWPGKEVQYVEAPPVVTDILLETEPAGAEVSFIPLSATDGGFEPDKLVTAGQSPIRTKLPPGRYLVVAALDESRFHEVYRDVPVPGAGLPAIYRFRIGEYQPHSDGTIELQRIEIPPEDVAADMAYFAGRDEFLMGEPNSEWIPQHAVNVQPFWLEKTEATVADFERFKTPDPHSTYQLQLLGLDPPSLEHPLMGFSWERAANLAELAGKRLPDEAEYEFAATNGGTSRFPWGNDPPTDATGWWEWRAVGTWKQDSLQSNPSVVGLFSNVAEWTSTPGVLYPVAKLRTNPQASFQAIVRGRYPPDSETDDKANPDFGVRTRYAQLQQTLNKATGLRFARSSKPRLRAERFPAYSRARE